MRDFGNIHLITVTDQGSRTANPLACLLEVTMSDAVTFRGENVSKIRELELIDGGAH